MRENVELTAGLLCSERLMHRLTEALGRDRAHHLVMDIAQEAGPTGTDFRDLAAAEPSMRFDELLNGRQELRSKGSRLRTQVGRPVDDDHSQVGHVLA